MANLLIEHEGVNGQTIKFNSFNELWEKINK